MMPLLSSRDRTTYTFKMWVSRTPKTGVTRPGRTNDGYKATIHGGNGVAIGSLGQYLEDSSVENVVVRDVQILTHNNDMHTAAYIKTWVGELVAQNPTANGYYENGG